MRLHLVAAAAALALQACTIVPGLQIDPTDRNQAQGASVTEASDGEETITFANGGAVSSIRVLPVTNATLGKVAQTLTAPQLDALPEVTEPEYTIGVGDVLSVVVWDHPELTNPSGAGSAGNDVNSGRVVDAQGNIYYPYVGNIRVVGLTPTALRAKLNAGLARVIQNPQVDVRVAQYRSRRVQVSGAVTNPGAVMLDDTNKGVIEAVNERGGISQNGSKRVAMLTRNGKTYQLDAQQVISSRGIAANPRLQAGDVLFVPDRTEDQVFVMGAVRTEGTVFLDGNRATLTQALAQSGGLDRTLSNDAGILVFRRPAAVGQQATVLKIDMGNPLGMLLAGEVTLQPRDVVYVASTDFSRYNSVINQLLPTISAVFQLDRLVNR